MCCFLNRQRNNNYFCNCTPFVPYFWQGNMAFDNGGYGYSTTNNGWANANNALLPNQRQGGFGYPQNTTICCITNYGNRSNCLPQHFIFPPHCRGTRLYANNFALDRPVSASFLHTQNYINLLGTDFSQA